MAQAGRQAAVHRRRTPSAASLVLIPRSPFSRMSLRSSRQRLKAHGGKCENRSVRQGVGGARHGKILGLRIESDVRGAEIKAAALCLHRLTSVCHCLRRYQAALDHGSALLAVKHWPKPGGKQCVIPIRRPFSRREQWHTAAIMRRCSVHARCGPRQCRWCRRRLCGHRERL
jgi:hypothetical protein